VATPSEFYGFHGLYGILRDSVGFHSGHQFANSSGCLSPIEPRKITFPSSDVAISLTATV
jgi:hypothetical protein